MKNTSLYIVCICLSSLITSCSKESNINEVWAELVESKTVLLKPEGWDDEYWNSVNKKVDNKKIFETILDAVLSGKQTAYNILSDEPLTIAQVKEIINNDHIVESGSAPSKKISAEDLSMIRMREKWSFNKDKFTLSKQVTRIDLLLKKVDESGVYIGDKALFYVNVNK